MLNEKDDSGTLYEYYLLLVGDGDDSGIVYGNHQTLATPVTQGLVKLEEYNYFVNGYGWDMQGWNKKHCELTMHNGVDIVRNSGSAVYAMFSGEILQAENEYIVLAAEGDYSIDLWYDDDRDMKLTYSAVNPTVSSGDFVEAGDIIGYTTSNRKCYTMPNQSTGCDYLHISLELKYGILPSSWKTVDPRLIIGLDNH